MAWRIANIVMALIFLLCVLVQYNDPDPLRWMLMYGYACMVTAMAAFNRYSVLSLIGVIGYVVLFIYWVPRETLASPSHIFTDLQMHEKGVEEAREAFGLLIAGAWMAALSVVWYRRRGKTLTD